MATRELMSKTTPSGFAAIRKSSGSERRGSRRCKITQLLRLRPSDPEREHFEDLRGTLSVSRSGVYFHSSELGYELGMRLFITLPYANDPATMSREYLAEVVRKDPLPNGLHGIGIKILMEMGMQHTYSLAPATQPK
jgi:hypothetical protein